jgi:hypothetical protein
MKTGLSMVGIEINPMDISYAILFGYEKRWWVSD